LTGKETGVYSPFSTRREAEMAGVVANILKLSAGES
jgi:hypothetical protein